MQESSGEPHKESDQTDFEIGEPAAISERVARPLQSRKRRYIENEPLPPQLEKRHKGKDKTLAYGQ